MKNITLNENAQGVTVHTPHGKIIVHIQGGEEYTTNQTNVTVIGKLDGEHFMQVGNPAVQLETPEALMVFPENPGHHIHSVSIRTRAKIAMKEMGDPGNLSPLGKLAQGWLRKRNKEKTA